jgi:hypothetical protein
VLTLRTTLYDLDSDLLVLQGHTVRPWPWLTGTTVAHCMTLTYWSSRATLYNLAPDTLALQCHLWGPHCMTLTLTYWPSSVSSEGHTVWPWPRLIIPTVSSLRATMYDLDPDLSFPQCHLWGSHCMTLTLTYQSHSVISEGHTVWPWPWLTGPPVSYLRATMYDLDPDLSVPHCCLWGPQCMTLTLTYQSHSVVSEGHTVWPWPWLTGPTVSSLRATLYCRSDLRCSLDSSSGDFVAISHTPSYHSLGQITVQIYKQLSNSSFGSFLILSYIIYSIL